MQDGLFADIFSGQIERPPEPEDAVDAAEFGDARVLERPRQGHRLPVRHVKVGVGPGLAYRAGIVLRVPGRHLLREHAGVGPRLFLRLDSRREIGQLLQGFRAGPGLRGRPAPLGHDQADRHSEGFPQVPPEEVGDGGEAARRLRGAGLPRPPDIRFRQIGEAIGDMIDMQQRVSGGGDGLRAGGGPAQCEAHVGLATAQVDLAHEDVLHRHRVARPGDRKRIRSARLHRRQVRPPPAILRGGANRLAAKLYRDGLAVGGAAEDGDLLPLLQDGPVGKQAAGRDGGLRGRGRQCCSEEQVERE